MPKKYTTVYEIKFDIDGFAEDYYTDMLCIPRKGEVISDFHLRSTVNPRNEDYEGDTVDLRVEQVRYSNVGKYRDGSHRIEVHASADLSSLDFNKDSEQK